MYFDDYSYNCLGAQIATGFVGFDKTSPYTKGQNFYSVPRILGEVTVIYPEQTSVAGARHRAVEDKIVKTAYAVHEFAKEEFLLVA